MLKYKIENYVYRKENLFDKRYILRECDENKVIGNYYKIIFFNIVWIIKIR